MQWENGTLQPWDVSMMLHVILEVLNQIHHQNHCQGPSPNHSRQGPDLHPVVATAQSQVLVGNPGLLWNKECWVRNHRLRRRSYRRARDHFS
jgi:hypothetical protein